MERQGRLVIEAALAEATAQGWGALRLHRVAERAGLPLPDVLGMFRDTDAIADAWFAQAQEAMLTLPEAELAGLPPARRVERALMRWFEHQAPHRRLVGAMLRAKMHPSHPHHWVPAVFHLSRLVHAALEAARLDARGLARQAEEVVVTAAFLGALARFPGDDPALPRTRRMLARGLAPIDRLKRRHAGR